VVVRNLLAELAERIDVRVLSWKGAPIPVFKPSQREVREMLEALSHHTKIQAHADGCTGFTHSHHEKVIVIDGRVAFVGGIDLTLDGGDPWDTPSHVARGGIGWHDAAVRIEGPGGLRIFVHVVLPLLKAILVTLAILSFLGACNDFMGPLSVRNDESRHTLPVARATLSREHVQDVELMMAGAVVTVLPVLALFLVLQKHYLQGLMAGGVKG
jgi:hypothetical protein